MLEDEFEPPFCKRLRSIRDAKREEALAAGDAERARQLTQEGMAKAIGVTLKAYRAYEKDREPDHLRRRDIARALGMEQDAFETATLVVTSDQIESLRQEMEALRRRSDETERRLDDALRGRLAPGRSEGETG